MLNENSINQSPIRVAQVIGKLNAAGVEAVMNNYYRYIDREKYQFDFIVDADGECTPKQDLVALGARYYMVPPYQNVIQHYLALKKLFKENQYRIVHAGMNSLSVISLFAAWTERVPVRINHSHNTAGRGEFTRTALKNILRPFAKVFATDCCACSQVAGEWLFGKKAFRQGTVTILHNAIDPDVFRFNPEIRDKVREDLQLQNRFVIGHVGRLCHQKNQEFVLDVFAELYKEQKDSRLVFVGNGTTDEQLKKRAEQMGIRKAVLFLGVREDVNFLYQAMDVFLFPSRYEGLGLAAVEAQCAGLPVIASTEVPLESKVSGRIQYLDLETNIDIWTAAIMKVREQNADRDIWIDARYDIRKEAKKLENYYNNALKKHG